MTADAPAHDLPFTGRTWFLWDGGMPQLYRTVPAASRGGAVSLRFDGDGSFHLSGPGPSDRTGSGAGRWSPDPADPTLVTVEYGGRTVRYRVRMTGADGMALEEHP